MGHIKITNDRNRVIYTSDKPTEKRAKCDQCGRITSDDEDLPFYKKLDKPRIQEVKGVQIHINAYYYCGDSGWD